MSDVNVDTLVEQAREVAVMLAKGATYPDMELETLMELVSDLAARARERDELEWGRNWQYDKAIGWRERALSAEAERLRLARRVAELEAEKRDLHNEIDCRIEHGAESGGHLEYVRDRLAGDGGGA